MELPKLEDLSVFEFQGLAQEIIDKLCEENDVPKIPVIFKDTLPEITAAAVFSPKKYHIEICKLTSGHALVHEFCHYVLELITVADNLNENFTERASNYYEWEMRDKERKVDTEMKGKLEDFDKRQGALVK